MATIGKRILDRRRELGWTQEDLAKKMGYKTKSAINKIEMGINDVTQSKVKRFSEVLNVPISYLMGWDDEPEETAAKHAEILTNPELLELCELYLSLDARDRDVLRTMAATMAQKKGGLKISPLGKTAFQLKL